MVLFEHTIQDGAITIKESELETEMGWVRKMYKKYTRWYKYGN